MNITEAFPDETGNSDKIKELILYISEQLSNDSKFGSTKLNKVLFFADFLQYRKTRKSITNQEYWKLDNGPTPKYLVPIREQMREEGSLEIEDRDYWGRPQRVPVAKRKSNTDVFTAKEMSLIDFVIEQLRPLDATECSQKSHEFIGWELAEMRETIPFGLALITHPEDDTKEQMEYCEQMQRRAEKWLLATT